MLTNPLYPQKMWFISFILIFCLEMINFSGDTVTLYYALENNSILNKTRMMNWSPFVMCACLSFLKMNSLSLLITGRNLSLISSIQHIPSFLFKVKKCSLVNLLLLLVSDITVSELQSGVVIICVGSMGKCTLLLEEIQLFVKVFLHCWTTQEETVYQKVSVPIDCATTKLSPLVLVHSNPHPLPQKEMYFNWKPTV